MIEQGFRGNCDSLGKLGMCPSLAEPDLSGFPRNGFHNVSRETLLNDTREKNPGIICSCTQWLKPWDPP